MFRQTKITSKKGIEIPRFTVLAKDYTFNDVDLLMEAIPLLTIFDVHEPQGKKSPNPFGSLTILGTAFFVSPHGIFITAKHNVEEHHDLVRHGKLRLMVFNNNQYTDLTVRGLELHPKMDIAIGCIMIDATKKSAPHLKIADRICPAGEIVGTYGYPNSSVSFSNGIVRADINNAIYDGLVLQYHENPSDRISAKVEMPYYSHSCPLGSGISGGPLLRLSDSTVYGINSTSIATNSASPQAPASPGVSTDIRPALDMHLPFIENGMTLREASKNKNSGIKIVGEGI